MKAMLYIHALFFVVVNAAIVLGWLMAGGTPDAVRSPIIAARDSGFWPLWLIVGWGSLLVLHIGLTVLIAGARRGGSDGDGDIGGGTGRPWLAVMFTDLTGSTALASELGDEAWSELITTYRRIVRDVAAAHDGSEVGTQGDGILLRFRSPREAADCAQELQQRLDEVRTDGSEMPPVKVGLHAGQAMERDDDVLGQMVNIAARVADAADGDEILVTEPVADHAREEMAFEDRGLLELKGVEGARHVLAMRWNGHDPG
jgi:class 3 adenylate cyclase